VKIPIKEISVKKKFNPREALDPAYVRRLTESVTSTKGTIQPILIRESDHELIDGRHRIEAAKRAGQKTIECRLTQVSDVDARILALTLNSFGKRLSPLEMGKGVYELLSTVKKRAGREKLKRRIARELGMNSTSKLEDCLTTYRQLVPEVRDTISTSVELGLVRTEHLRQIRALPENKQLAITKQIVTEKDPARVDRFISSFMATEEPSERYSLTRKEAQTPATDERRVEPESFVAVFKFNLAGRVKSAEQGLITIESNKGSANLLSDLDAALATFRSKVQIGDNVVVSLLLESPARKRSGS
jgi:ParB/RepB/Spo0J family partition protein